MPYAITAGDASTDMGRVATAPTLLAAKRAGRKAIREALPDGCGSYRVIDDAGRTVASEERSMRTRFSWLDTTEES